MLELRQVADFLRVPPAVERQQAVLEFYRYLRFWREEPPVDDNDSEAMIQNLFRQCMKPPPHVKANAFLLLAWAFRFQGVASPFSFWAAVSAVTGLAAFWTWALIRLWIKT
jgi:hypothetical protein